MLFFSKLRHAAEGFAVGVDVIQHVGVLVAAEPLILPVEAERPISFQVLFQCVLVDVHCVNPALTINYSRSDPTRRFIFV